MSNASRTEQSQSNVNVNELWLAGSCSRKGSQQAAEVGTAGHACLHHAVEHCLSNEMQGCTAQSKVGIVNNNLLQIAFKLVSFLGLLLLI